MSENKTLYYFKELTKIPRESGNEKEIADYLCQFAQNHNLEYSYDQYHNVLIKKKTCNKKPIILQAHTDMVCVKEDNSPFDFTKNSLTIIEKDGYITAQNTSLGADNGIGVAQILNILDSDLLCNIEAVFTSEEETSMDGAIHFDMSKLKGTMLINLDGFEENTIIIESACFYDILMHTNFTRISNTNPYPYKISLSGLEGGHSGFDIDKSRGNASILLAQFLSSITPITIDEFKGGEKFNVIPSTAYSTFSTTQSLETIKNDITTFINKNRILYKNLKITIESTPIKEVFTKLDSQHLLQAVISFPHGVFYKEQDQLIASINLGAVDTTTQQFKVGMRSSRKKQELQCLEILQNYCKKQNLIFDIIGSQPGFESNQDSYLITCLKNSFPDDIQKLQLKSVHITVESGFFQERIPNLDLAIISPNIQNAHTIHERVEIASVLKTDQWLHTFLKTY